MPLFRFLPPVTLRALMRVNREYAALGGSLLNGTAIGLWAGLLAGCASAWFLFALEYATSFRETHPYLLFGLPIAGVTIAALFEGWGKNAAGGNNLLLERLHSVKGMEAVPLRMVPSIFGTTVLTHLFGGSAGREGVATQMGGTLASATTGFLRLHARDHKRLVRAGISGGFGAVFGTPLAGCIFGLEVTQSGRLDYADFVPCLVAALFGDCVCRAWGVHHAVYALSNPAPQMTPFLIAVIALSSVAFGLAAGLFAELTHAISRLSRRVKSPLLRPVVGGLVVIALTYVVGTRDYLGLSLPLIARALTPGAEIFWGAWICKLLFTSVTLGTGFKGGEVTPLFCIGATLGAVLAHLFHVPAPFLAALGFVAVFAGAANTPLACVFMGIELFGAQMALPLTLACFIAYLFSGHRGIYANQIVGTSKAHGIVLAPNTRIGGASHTARIRLPHFFKR